MIDVLNIQLVAQAHQLAQGLVGIVGVVQHVAVEHQIVAGPVAHQHHAVAVQNLAPGGADPGDSGIRRARIGLRVRLQNLLGVQPEPKDPQHHGEGQQNGHRPEFCHSFHSWPPILPSHSPRGYSTG